MARKKATKVISPRVAEYDRRLTAALGDENRHNQIMAQLRSDKTMKADDLKQLARVHASAPAKSGAQALTKIAARNGSLLSSLARSLATGGRSAAAVALAVGAASILAGNSGQAMADDGKAAAAPAPAPAKPAIGQIVAGAGMVAAGVHLVRNVASTAVEEKTVAAGMAVAGAALMRSAVMGSSKFGALKFMAGTMLSITGGAGLLSSTAKADDGKGGAEPSRVTGAANRNFMPDVMAGHPNQETAGSYNRMTNWAEGINGPEASRIADRVQANYAPATQALGNVMARRAEIARGEGSAFLNDAAKAKAERAPGTPSGNAPAAPGAQPGPEARSTYVTVRGETVQGTEAEIRNWQNRRAK